MSSKKVYVSKASYIEMSKALDTLGIPFNRSVENNDQLREN